MGQYCIITLLHNLKCNVTRLVNSQLSRNVYQFPTREDMLSIYAEKEAECLPSTKLTFEQGSQSSFERKSGEC